MGDDTTPWVAIVLAAALPLLCTPILASSLRRRGLVDVANSRSSHAGAVPRGGGVVVLAGVALGVVVSPSPSWTPELAAACALGLLAASVGAIDDLRGGTSAPARLTAVLAVGVCCAWMVLVPSSPLGILIVGTAGVGVVALTNAVNFMDGINGITSLHGGIFGVSVAVLADRFDARGVLVVGCCLAAASLGFLPWNLRGRIFLGDVGSYGIGALAGGLVIVLIDAGAPFDACIGCLMPYLADTGTTLVRRIVRGHALSKAHRLHAYQALADRLDSHVLAALLVALLSAACSTLTIAGSTQGPLARTSIFVGAATLAVLYPLLVNAPIARLEPSHR